MRLKLILSVVLATGFVVFGFWLLVQANQDRQQGEAFRAAASSATGTVIEMIEEPSPIESLDEPDRTIYTPLVRFETESGVTVEFKGPGSKPPAYRAGDTVDVLYLSSDFANARIDDFRSNSLGVWIMRVFAAVFLAAGGLSLFVLYRNRSGAGRNP